MAGATGNFNKINNYTNANNLNIPTSDSLEENKLMIQKKAKEVRQDKEELKKVYESNNKEKNKLEMTFGKVGINFPTKQGGEKILSDKSDKYEKQNKGGKNVARNIQKALEYYDIVYS